MLDFEKNFCFSLSLYILIISQISIFLRPAQRVKSVGDLLDSRSLVDQSFYDHDTPGNIRRPKSLYEGPHVSSVTQVETL